MNKRNWDNEDYKLSKRENKKDKKTKKCPYCGQEIKNICKDCGIILEKGKWKEVYE